MGCQTPQHSIDHPVQRFSRKRSTSVGGHRMTRAGNLSLPLPYYQYSHTAYHIRAGLPGKEISFILCPLTPPTRRGLRGTCRPINDSLLLLFIPQCLNRVEQGGFSRRIKSKKYPNRAGKEKGQEDRLDREKGWPLGKTG
jgi:hypothetical protein